MSRDRIKFVNESEEEEELSAFLDGELSFKEEEAFRIRMTQDSALAERCEALAEVNGALQSMVEPAPAPERLERIHQALRAQLTAEPFAGEVEERLPLRSAPLWRRGTSLVGGGAALAAGVALYLAWATGSGSGRLELLPPEAPALTQVVVPQEEPALPLEPVELIAPAPVLSLASEASEGEAATPSETFYSDNEEEQTVLVQAEPVIPAAVEKVDPVILPDADEQLAIAIEYEMLADFDVISNLELLEVLGRIEAVESM